MNDPDLKHIGAKIDGLGCFLMVAFIVAIIGGCIATDSVCRAIRETQAVQE